MNNQKKGMFLIGSFGIFLMSAWMLTAKQGISMENQRIYQEAVKLQEKVEALGFKGFCLSDFPVAMYDGKWDYVFYKGKVEKREPALSTFVGTAFPVEDHFEVIVPTLEQLDSLMSVVGGVEGMLTGEEYDFAQQKATIWHEAFHAYQLTNFGILGEKVTTEDMRAELEESKESDAPSQEEWLVREVDQKKGLKSKLEGEMMLLKKAVETDASDIDELRRIVLEYSERRDKRLKEMPKEAREAEIRCELTEGTAYYVEASVYRLACGDEAYKERYLDNLEAYEGGRGKYYRTGFAKCLILDRLAPDWKETFDFTKGLDEVLEKYGSKDDEL